MVRHDFPTLPSASRFPNGLIQLLPASPPGPPRPPLFTWRHVNFLAHLHLKANPTQLEDKVPPPSTLHTEYLILRCCFKGLIFVSYFCEVGTLCFTSKDTEAQTIKSLAKDHTRKKKGTRSWSLDGLTPEFSLLLVYGYTSCLWTQESRFCASLVVLTKLRLEFCVIFTPLLYY